MNLTLENVIYRYETGNEVLNGIDLTLSDGEILCLLGPNGSGKTTLFKLILGLMPPSGGRVTLNGRDVTAYPRRELGKILGYVPQNHIPAFPYSVLDMVVMGRNAHLENGRAPKQKDYDIARGALEDMGIESLAEKNYIRISGGERQLVLIARALAQQAKILILDEPTGNLDFGNQVRVLRQIRRLAKTGIAVLMSSHFPGDAFQNASRAALLKDGKIRESGAPEEVITEKNLKALYGVDVSVAAARDRAGNLYRVCVPARRD